MWDYKLVHIHLIESWYSSAVEDWPLGWNLFVEDNRLGTYNLEVMYTLTIL